jgi:acetyl esterase/lipase
MNMKVKKKIQKCLLLMLLVAAVLSSGCQTRSSTEPPASQPLATAISPVPKEASQPTPTTEPASSTAATEPEGPILSVPLNRGSQSQESVYFGSEGMAERNFIKDNLGEKTPSSTVVLPFPVNSTFQIIRDVEYGRGGGLPLYLDIYIPQKPIMKPMPAVVFIHGGGWQSGDKYPSQVQSIAQRGFFALSINYRLSGVATFPAAVEDCKCAVRWLRANATRYNVDPERIGVWGGSAGGHLALMVACTDETDGLEGNGGWETYSSRVQAVCSYYGPTDLAHMQDGGDTTAPARFIGGSPLQKPEVYKLASPVTHVTPDDPPLLMVHGESDRVVPYTQSVTMQEAYHKLGLKVELVKVLNAGHGFQPIGDKVMSPLPKDIFQKMLDFFVRELCRP